MARHQAARPDRPEVRIHCEAQDCTASFTRTADASRHQEETHGPQKPCPVSGCSFLWRRKDRCNKHLQREHHLVNCRHYKRKATSKLTRLQFNFMFQITCPQTSLSHKCGLVSHSPKVRINFGANHRQLNSSYLQFTC